MAPLPPVPGVVKVRLFWSIGGFGGCNILHWAYTGGPPDSVTCANLAQDFYTQFVATNCLHSIASNTSLLECRVTDLSSDTGAEGQHLATTAGGDSFAGSCQIAVVVKLPVALRYRGGHPKTFYPPFGDDKKADASSWIGSRCSDFSARLISWQIAMFGTVEGDTTLGGQVAVSYRLAHEPRITPLVLTVGEPICDTRQGSMRRRRLQPVSI